jgi:hypothetical protein
MGNHDQSNATKMSQISPSLTAEEKQLQTLKWLQKQGKQNKQAMELANKLEGCTGRRLCESLACPRCAEKLQHEFAAALGRFLEKRQRRGGSVVCMTIALPSLTIPAGELAKLDLPKAKRQYQRRLNRSKVGVVIGAWDYSFNEHKTNRYAPAWLMHLHGMAITDDPEGLKRRLQKQFPRSDAVPRPVKVQVWDGRKNALYYLLKSRFDRRVGMHKGERFNVKTGKPRQCRVTSQQRLRAAERLELLLRLDGIGRGGRLFLRKVQMRRGRAGLSIVRLA